MIILIFGFDVRVATASVIAPLIPTIAPEFKTPVQTSALLATGTTLLASIFYFAAQPLLPIHVSLAEPAAQLVAREWLALFPIFSWVVVGLHAVLIISEDTPDLIQRLFAWSAVAVNVVALLSLMRIVYSTA